MPVIPRSQVLVYVAAAIAIVVVGARYLRSAGEEPAAPTPAPLVREEREAGPGATVHVAGAVRRPGLYEMAPGARIADALERAGGATSRADLAAINLAAKAEDGRQVLVPVRGAGGPAAGAAPVPGATSPPGAAAAGSTAVSGPPVDLNTATLEQLDTLDGIGPGLAQRILAYRDEKGGFGSVDELSQVPGIGDKRLAAIRERVGV